nr:hypothetical protein [Tanacetum cinerariifolium]
FAKTDSMKAVPLPLSGDYTSLSDHNDLDESQMSYGTKSSTSSDSKTVPNDFVSCDNSDKSLEVNTNDFAFSDSSVKSLEPKPNDSTSCASTSSVSTSVNEAEIESNVGIPIQEAIIVQDLPSFSCNSSDKNEHISRTSCNKNVYKKADHFRKMLHLFLSYVFENDGVISAKEFGMIAGCDSKNAIKEGENELGWDDSAFSVFTTNSEDVEGRPIFYRFAKTDSMKAVPSPLTGDHTSLSDHTDLDESQMSYDTKSSTSCDPKYVPDDFVSCDDSDKSSEVNTNEIASSDSSLKSSEHKPTDSTSCASTSSVSISVNEAEIESNVGTPIKETISV